MAAFVPVSELKLTNKTREDFHPDSISISIDLIAIDLKGKFYLTIRGSQAGRLWRETLGSPVAIHHLNANKLQ
jgi:hypothetical protein